MRPNSRSLLRAVCAILACVVYAGCAGSSGLAADANLSGIQEPGGLAEQEVEALLRTWFGSILQTGADADALERSVPLAGFSLELFGATITSAAGLRHWNRALTRTYTRVDHEVSSIEIDVESPGVYRARVDVTRHALDRDGLVHLARRAQTWRVRRSAEPNLTVLGVTEATLIPDSGTGSRVMCL